ncbi:dihydropteridine reductase [Nannochloropsis oceanica]
MAAAAIAAKQAVIVVGGSGALGKSVVQRLLSNNNPFNVINIDYLPNPHATHSVPLMSATATMAWHEAAAHALTEVRALLRLDSGPALQCRAVLHVAGGWCGGGMSDAGFLKSVDRMWRFNVQSAALAAHMAEVFMTPSMLPPTVPNEMRSSGSNGTVGGLVVLTGAGAALDPSTCTGMVGYGLSKSATHFMVKTMAVDPGLREGGVTALSLLPSTIDTTANRMAMPDADFGAWTKPEEIADKLATWVEDATQRPPSGSLVKVVTSQGKTSWMPL